MTDYKNLSTYDLARRYEALCRQEREVQGALEAIGGMWEPAALKAAEALGPLTGRVMSEIRAVSEELKRRG